jgi:hypothetical protein
MLPCGPRLSAWQLHRSVHPLDFGRARSTSLRASLIGLPVSTGYGLVKNPATNHRATRRDRTNVYMCHVDHLLQLPWAHCRRVPPTEAARPQSDRSRMTLIAMPVKISPLGNWGKRLRRRDLRFADTQMACAPMVMVPIRAKTYGGVCINTGSLVMKWAGMYLVGFIVLIGGIMAALWKLGMLQRIGTVWTLIGVAILVGIGIMISVSHSGTKENIQIDRK